jgi:hypothetical protein
LIRKLWAKGMGVYGPSAHHARQSGASASHVLSTCAEPLLDCWAWVIHPSHDGLSSRRADRQMLNRLEAWHAAPFDGRWNRAHCPYGRDGGGHRRLLPRTRRGLSVPGVHGFVSTAEAVVGRQRDHEVQGRQDRISRSAGREAVERGPGLRGPARRRRVRGRHRVGQGSPPFALWLRAAGSTRQGGQSCRRRRSASPTVSSRRSAR